MYTDIKSKSGRVKYNNNEITEITKSGVRLESYISAEFNNPRSARVFYYRMWGDIQLF